MELNNIPPVDSIQKIQPLDAQLQADIGDFDFASLAKDLLADQGKEQPIQNKAVKVTSKQAKTENVELSEDDLQTAVSKMNTRLLGRDTKLAFKIHKRTGRTYVELVDMRTEKVLQEIPSSKMLDVIGKIWDQMGIAIDRKG
ncbi:flagellar protein FlaG [Liquorilactobacillus satsumensis]|uniref:Flagellar protein FlaG n=2 Tax=Liquorilactobacillus satsumensis TaxID=259059 RepID=A0A0R1V0H7_9LACO|nr:flagellar protein FlaG [Liquorilactobacillus satsumensis]AJA34272.1 flagellar protein FlaG [Liquorilactobacillus satsumensis]KRL99119.1 hypothetical protein FD50_GL000399 [Liquorilactobacillus satsumensis DSM 16230 = JCM 12392]MCP9312834.1 flagellar protein FlaG [Liquorilactobacillus satsumensis]MCP9359930.1 flagellar protein FlaG [Liquorilactobacillus satsumensis]